ncbi:hypothetical protein FOA52_012636 [Chlamydomonas sp. UWO 241]|nr:hypothetical protein FOA52_012636 [Chlamydomonas sp. UWO 241]
MNSALGGLFKRSMSIRDVPSGAPDRTSEFPTSADAYELIEDCGRGVSAIVWLARVKSTGATVAVKIMNLESVQNSLDEIVREAQVMKNYNHPNVLPLYTSFVHAHDLWLVVPFVSGGSVLHIMKYGHPEGLEEIATATIMRDVLRALDYVHRQGSIHRDVKAGNILVNKDGQVYLGDFGVATSMERNGSWGHAGNASRMTFVGTPCWMAPEVMEQTAGYDNAADVWSFGITMLEMAHGHAPFAKFPPMKVLLMTLQNPPPSLEDKGKRHFSKAMREVVAKCLQKDPRLRPTAAQLLEHKFFKQAKDEEYLARTIMAGMPSLGERVQQIRQGLGSAATATVDNDRDFHRSQEEYKKGVSSWNFDVAALKAQADAEDLDLLPTISEEREGIEGERASPPQSSNLAAAASAQVVSSVTTLAAAAPTFAPPSTPPPQQLEITSGDVSAFATPVWQAAALSGMSAGEAAAAAAATRAAESEFLPPADGMLSPSSQLSRESSVAGTTSALPPLLQGRTSTLMGRFLVHEGDQVPPRRASVDDVALAAVAVSGAAESHTQRSNGAAAVSAAPLPGTNIGGDAATDGAAAAGGGGSGGGSAAPAEEEGPKPKTKGRFTVIENTIERPSSGRNLASEGAGVGGDSGGGVEQSQAQPAGLTPLGAPTRMAGALGGGDVYGAGAVGTAATVVFGTGGAAAEISPGDLLPKLQELLASTSHQQNELMQLVAAIQIASESQGSAGPHSTGAARAPRASSPGAGWTQLYAAPGQPVPSPSTEGELRAAVAALSARLTDAEAEGSRLRARNAELEAMLGDTGHTAANLPVWDLPDLAPAPAGSSATTAGAVDAASAEPALTYAAAAAAPAVATPATAAGSPVGPPRAPQLETALTAPVPSSHPIEDA